MAAITSLLFVILLGPRFIKKLYELRTGQIMSRVEDVPVLAKLHERKKDTPTMGGLLILSSMVISLLLWMDLTNTNTHVLLITTVYLGIIGGLDDYLKLKNRNSKGLKAKTKFLLQLVFAVAFCFYYFQGSILYFFPFVKSPVFVASGLMILVGSLISIFVIIGASNAVNLTDGLDGLAAGCVTLAAMALAIIAFLSNHSEISKYLNLLYIEGSSEVAIYLCAVFGACLGFLWYNGHPAQVFMGDIGSLSLGGVLGVSAILLRREFLLGIIGGIFVLEALSVILQVLSYRFRKGKRIFLCSPLHHHFEYKGWPETKVVLRFWIIGLILALIGLGSIKFQ